MNMTRVPIWLALILVSTGIHLSLTWKAGSHLESKPVGEEGLEIRMVLHEDESVTLPPIEKEILEFEDPLEFEPPQILLAPKAIAPPPENVNLALHANMGSSLSTSLSPTPTMPGRGGKSIEGGGVGRGRGIGNGLGGSTNRFAAYVQSLREAGLDVVFLVDMTGSMIWVLDEAKSRIHDIVDTVRSLVPIARFGVVVYRDFDDEEYITRLQPLTFSTSKLNRFLGTLQAKGGGSFQEAVSAGLSIAIEESGWRVGAKRIIIIIGDAPPHNENIPKIIADAKQFAASGGQVTTLDVSHEANPELVEATLGRPVKRVFYRDAPMYEFQLIAEAGAGDASTLDGDIRITRRLVALIMGKKFAAEMTALLEAI